MSIRGIVKTPESDVNFEAALSAFLLVVQQTFLVYVYPNCRTVYSNDIFLTARSRDVYLYDDHIYFNTFKLQALLSLILRLERMPLQ